MTTPGKQRGTSSTRPPSRLRLYVPLVVFVIFLGLIVAGLALDEFASVLANAATICLSCIGIE